MDEDDDDEEEEEEEEEEEDWDSYEDGYEKVEDAHSATVHSRTILEPSPPFHVRQGMVPGADQPSARRPALCVVSTSRSAVSRTTWLHTS